MGLKAYGNNLIVELEEEKKTQGGLIIPESASAVTDKTIKSTVVSVGPGRILADGTVIKIGVEKGYVIWYNAFGGNPIDIKVNETDKTSQKFLVLLEEDILAVETKEQ